MAASTPSPPAFTVSPMTLSDFSDILRPENRRGGDLTVAPLSPWCWPVAEGDDREALRRLEYSTMRERKWFLVDPTSHHIMARTADGEIASIARWNFFPSGYDIEKNEPVGETEFLPDGALEVFKFDLYHNLRNGMMKVRQSWHKPGPAWVLTSLVTRECYRGQGAAKLLINWGVQRAREEGIPAYLEASPAGKPIYEKYGFHEVGEPVAFDMRPVGIDRVALIAKMAYFPESLPS